MSTRGFLIEILLHKCNVQQAGVISVFYPFYYLRIMRTFNRSLYYFLFKRYFHDCDVTTLKIIHPITFRNYKKHPIKVL